MKQEAENLTVLSQQCARRLANALYQRLVEGWHKDEANAAITTLKAIGGAKIPAASKHHDYVNHRLLVYSEPSKRLGCPGMRLYLPRDMFDRVFFRLEPLEQLNFTLAVKHGVLDEVFEVQGYTYVAVEYVRQGNAHRSHLNLMGCPQAFEKFTRLAHALGHVHFQRPNLAELPPFEEELEPTPPG